MFLFHMKQNPPLSSPRLLRDLVFLVRAIPMKSKHSDQVV